MTDDQTKQPAPPPRPEGGQGPLWAEPYKDGPAENASGPHVGDLLAPPPIPPSAERKAIPLPQTPLSNDKVGQVRTYKDDIANAVRTNDLSVTKIALAEARKRQRQQENAEASSPTSPRNMVLIAASFLLVLGGVIAGGYAFFSRQASQSQSPQTVAEKPLILPDSQKELDLSGLTQQDVPPLIQNTIQAANPPLDSVLELIPTVSGATGKSLIAGGDFLKLLSPSAPDALVRSINPSFVFGIHQYRNTESFLIYKVDSYQSAFAALLTWEPTMPYELGESFLSRAEVNSLRSSGAVFKDKVVENLDSRVIADPGTGDTVLMYSFVDKNTLVITTSEYTFREIIKRLSEAQRAY